MGHDRIGMARFKQFKRCPAIISGDRLMAEPYDSPISIAGELFGRGQNADYRLNKRRYDLSIDEWHCLTPRPYNFVARTSGMGMENDMCNGDVATDLWNSDLAPTSQDQPTWRWYHFAALWLGMVISVPAYMLAGGLSDAGMSPLQASLTVLLANAIVLIPILLVSHMGARIRRALPCRGACLLRNARCCVTRLGACGRGVRLVWHLRPGSAARPFRR